MITSGFTRLTTCGGRGHVRACLAHHLWHPSSLNLVLPPRSLWQGPGPPSPAPLRGQARELVSAPLVRLQAPGPHLRPWASESFRAACKAHLLSACSSLLQRGPSRLPGLAFGIGGGHAHLPPHAARLLGRMCRSGEGVQVSLVRAGFLRGLHQWVSSGPLSFSAPDWGLYEPGR